MVAYSGIDNETGEMLKLRSRELANTGFMTTRKKELRR